MHRLARIEITNFRSCRQAALVLDDFTPIVGYNNAGKSNILTAIEWLIESAALAAADFYDPTQTLRVTGAVAGISQALLDVMPTNQRNAITPYLVNGTLQFRRSMTQPGSAATAKLEVRDPAVQDELSADSWKPSPTGIPQALKALFPDVIRIRAMQNAADDVGKFGKSNTLGKLIAEIIEPVRQAHEAHLAQALSLIASKLSADGDQRAEELNAFDIGASTQLAELFPGLQIKLDVPLPEIPDLFKGGTVRVLETTGGNTASRTFDSVGHGAQRCIQMALIRYLAERKAATQENKRTLLLIDEPELYLHPQGVEQVRLALRRLAKGNYQVVFSTHSPLMLHREQATHTVVVRKPSPQHGTVIRKPLAAAVTEAINDAQHQSRVLFELGKAAEVFFSDRVLLNEGKTEQRLLPLLYEIMMGRTASSDRIGILPMDGSGNIAGALRVLASMEIDSKAVADLDFAFVQAAKAGLIDRENDQGVVAAKALLATLQTKFCFPLGPNGLPFTDKKTGWLAADVWARFALDSDGAKIVETQRQKMLAHGIWVWAAGTIEDVLGVREKGEQAIQGLEQQISSLGAEHLIAQFPAIKEFFDWVRAPSI